MRKASIVSLVFILISLYTPYVALAQIPSQPKKEVKAITTITAPLLTWSGTDSICGHSLYTGGYGCGTSPSTAIGVGTGAYYSSGFIGVGNIQKTATVFFNLANLPADETVISARVAPWISSCGSSAISVAGYGSVSGCNNIELTGNYALAIQGSKKAYNWVQFSLTGGSGITTFSSMSLIITYGKRDVDIKANGEDGPLSVKAGSMVNLSWSSTGFGECRYDSIPAWYTNGWPIGQKVPNPTSGSAVTKIYFENVTYRILCKDLNSGAVNSDQVTVNVTP